ncbi:MAG: sulfatase [Hyphomicrobiaceae bacterium]
MRSLFLLFDSLNARALSCYGGSLPTPNFERLAERAVTFDSHYIGSMPCMPARRDMHTGRLCFLHRSWGPLEPFDNSFPARLKGAGIYSHLISDHYHYFEDGGATYHTRYTTWDFVRGQESDPWIAMVKPPIERFRQQYHPIQFEDTRDGHRLQGMVNREAIKNESDFPCVQCFDAALSFLDRNGGDDHWLLQLETFDPHEPFFAPDLYKAAFPTAYEGPTLDWPRYRKVSETPNEIEELRANYAALVTLCDTQLGRILDDFDKHNRWDNTAIVLTTDHGFLLSEHDWWAKNRMPFYNEIANIPLFVYSPKYADKAGCRISALTQTTDIMPSLLDLFGQSPGGHVLGQSILPLIAGEADKIRDVALYGIFGGAINATDGRYTYFLYPDDMEDKELFEYTLMPMHNRSLFEIWELQQAGLHRGFDFTKGAPLLKIPALPGAKRSPRQGGFADNRTVLYDLKHDPCQTVGIDAPEVEEQMIRYILAEMKSHDAPLELYTRFGLQS